MKNLFLLAIILLSWEYTNAQSADNESLNNQAKLEVVLGVNQYIPFSHSFIVRTIPPFWYSFQEDELRIGGQTLGINLYKPFKEKWAYIGQAHLKNQRFSLGELTFTDENGQPIGAVSVTNQEFVIKHANLLGRQMNNAIFAIGVGADIYLASYGVLDRRDIAGTILDRRINIGEQYKNISPFVSCLFVQHYGKWSLNIQADYAFLNRYNVVIENSPKPTYLSISVGAGFRI